MKRRTFLKNGTAASVPFVLNGMPLRAYGKSSLLNWLNIDHDRILVLVQCNGGNDGLNTVLPLDQYSNLARARQNILIPENKAFRLTDETGLHPSCAGFRNLYDEGKLAIVQAVGYPGQNRSHFRSTDIWVTGSPANEFWTTGWVGRYYDSQIEGYPNGYPNEDYPDPFAITVGSIVSETCQGNQANYSLAIQDPFRLSPLTEGEGSETPENYYGDELSFIRTAISQTNAYTTSIGAAAEKGANLSDLYPENNLANQLKTVAYLIAGGLKTKVYVVTIGGFDTHANQADSNDSTIGVHANLLQQLSSAIEAFQDDLRLLGLERKVMGMVYTEFNRRILSNNSMGTDHGDAGPLFLFGSCVQPGLHGSNPIIPDEVGRGDGVALQFDFRDVYGTILEDWFEADSASVQAMLYNGFSKLPVLSYCATTSVNSFASAGLGRPEVFPNPAHAQITLRFKSRGEKMQIALYDVLGAMRGIIAEKYFNAGEHQIPYHIGSLAPGSYVINFRGKTVVDSQSFIKR